MKKKYLTTVEEVLALKDTDTKIYAEKDEGCYYQFVKGILCCFSTNSDHVCIGYWMTLTMNLYILVEEPVKEADKNDIGKLCWFWDEKKHIVKQIGVLKRFEPTLIQMRYCTSCGTGWKHCRRLTPEEVAEITGYKVEN